MTSDCPHAAWLHAHHLTLYCQGGLSVPSRMVLLCSKCHRNVHRGHLRSRVTPEASLDWQDARGFPLGQANPGFRRRSLLQASRLLAVVLGASSSPPRKPTLGEPPYLTWVQVLSGL